jgi:hypothetical protein
MAIVHTDEGSLRILYADASESRRDQIQVFASEALDISEDPRQQKIVPKSRASIGEDDKMILEYKALAATNIDYTADETFTKMRIPVTVKNVNTGNVFETILRHPDFATADVTVPVADQWTVIGKYTVGAQERVKLGHSIAENSRIYVQLAETGST